jgi:glycosyltransferase involved in cell wall biosynthesis
MKKLLYITNQQEYDDHGAIDAVFGGYLRIYLKVNIVYFTKFKHSFQKKGEDFVVPEGHKKDICNYLEEKGVDLLSYNYVFVRNMYDILKQVQKEKKKYNYKVGFRVSKPHTTQVYEVKKLQNDDTVLSRLSYRFGNFRTSRLINKCDIFLPNSNTMKKIFYPNVKTKTLALRPGLDPARVQPYLHTTGDDVTFVYVGTIDVINRFEFILEAFCSLKTKNWQLHIITKNPSFIREMLDSYPDVSKKVTIKHAINQNILMEEIHLCDIGIALFPQLPIHQSTIPAKVIEYYTCAIPTLINNNKKNKSVFDDGENAFFCDFTRESIVKKLEVLMDYSPKELAKVGENGQRKLLGLHRNYEIMAKNLYKTLEEL